MKQALAKDIEAAPTSYFSIHLNRNEFIAALGELDSVDDLNMLREKTTDLKLRVGSLGTNMLVDSDSNGDFVALRRDVLSSEFDQILEARTLERAKYYIKRLERGVRKVRTSS